MWIGPPLIENLENRDFNKLKNEIQQTEKQQEEELAAIRDFKPEIDVTYGFNDDVENDNDNMNVVGDEEEISEEDDTSTQQADDDDDDMGFLDVDDSDEYGD